MISPGALVLCSKSGRTAWVAERRLPGGQWKLVCKAVDHKLREVFSSMTVGEGDLTVVAPAPTYAVGDAVEHNGMQHAVAADLGDAVELIVPATRRPLRGGGYLHIAAGNNITLSKADLVLEDLR